MCKTSLCSIHVTTWVPERMAGHAALLRTQRVGTTRRHRGLRQLVTTDCAWGLRLPAPHRRFSSVRVPVPATVVARPAPSRPLRGLLTALVRASRQPNSATTHGPPPLTGQTKRKRAVPGQVYTRSLPTGKRLWTTTQPTYRVNFRLYRDLRRLLPRACGQLSTLTRLRKRLRVNLRQLT